MNRIITFLVLLGARNGDMILTSKMNKGEEHLVLSSVISPNFDTDLIFRTTATVL